MEKKVVLTYLNLNGGTLEGVVEHRQNFGTYILPWCFLQYHMQIFQQSDSRLYRFRNGKYSPGNSDNDKYFRLSFITWHVNMVREY